MAAPRCCDFSEFDYSRLFDQESGTVTTGSKIIATLPVNEPFTVSALSSAWNIFSAVRPPVLAASEVTTVVAVLLNDTPLNVTVRGMTSLPFR